MEGLLIRQNFCKGVPTSTECCIVVVVHSATGLSQRKKVAIDGWGRLMEAITLNNCCVGMGCIALLFVG
jgi:hypothetical protein